MIRDIKRNIRRNASLANWQGRTVRLVTVVTGFLIAMPKVNDETGWGSFIDIASKPLQALGLVLIVMGALFTRGDQPAVEPES